VLSRYINSEFINLGFSGNGMGEPELAHLIAQIEQPALLVLDFEANVGDPLVYQERLPEFIRIYREYHPEVPILVVSKIRYARERFHTSALQLADERRRIARDTVEAYRSAGDANIQFFDGSDLLGEDYEECTVDGVHPTDLGFIRMAYGLNPVLKKILQIEE
jgi:lysophospholipase L1-like esterase